MPNSLCVKLKNVRILVSIGLLPEEKILKNILVINVSVFLKNTDTVLDYAMVFQEIKKKSTLQYDYLEDFAKTIAQSIQQLTTDWQAIEIEVEKINPPIIAFDGSASVVYKVEQ